MKLRRNTMQLSSNITPFAKHWGLAFSLVMFPVGLSMIARTPDLLILLWTVSLPFIMWWLWSFKEVGIDGDCFIIGNHKRAITAPFSHLKDFSESRSNRSSYITLVFNPPTTYGRKIRFWPPLSDRFNREPDRISSLLRDIIKQNAKSPARFQDSQNIDQSRRWQRLNAKSPEASPKIGAPYQQCYRGRFAPAPLCIKSITRREVLP